MKLNSWNICFVLALLNALVTYRNWITGVGQSLWRAFKQPQVVAGEVEAGVSIEYTYVDEDYPLYHPVSSGPLPDAAMTMYESIHYSIEAPDNMSMAAAEAAAEWKLMSNTPTTFGRVRLGPEDRILLVTAWHFRHCLHSFQKTFAGLTDPASESAYYHASHCLNYLRQWFLCTAASNLEEGDFLDGVLTDGDLKLLPAQEREERRRRQDSSHHNGSYATAGWNPGRIRGEQVCKDWDVLIHDIESNNQRYLDWANDWN